MKAQIRERAELDEDMSKRISKFATKELARPEDWCSEDRADVDFLSSVQLQCAQQMAQASRSFRDSALPLLSALESMRSALGEQ